MKSFVWLAALLSLSLFAQPASALDDAKARQVMANAVDGYIRPAYKDFHQRAAALVSETSKFCAAPTDDGLMAVQARFAETVASWGHIEFLREGPVMQQNRLERILFYPDRKSTGLKQVQALLANPDDTVTDATKLKDRSVAIQGLGAFEFLFYGTYPEAIVSEKDSFRCRYGLAIAGNVESIAGELQAAWDASDGIAKDWKNPSADNPIYRDGKEAVSALIGVAVHGLEMVRDQRIKHFYKGRDAKVSPKLAVYWRSGLTMTALAANVDGLAGFWKVTDMALLLDSDLHSLSESVGFDFNAALAALKRLDQPTAERLKDGKYLDKLDFIEFNLKDAMTRIDSDVGGAVGLGAGFSFADGD
ncbi:imelysin family protein [Rhizobium sp. LjRoot254]|uniref:imelysin family protein n=1 Tax=Rhizobium sp. LjRoot254 TaxID=3342297 RepID=UPI003ED06B85